MLPYPLPKQAYLPGLAPPGVLLEGREAVAFASEHGCWLRCADGVRIGALDARQWLAGKADPRRVWLPRVPEWPASAVHEAIELATSAAWSVVVLAVTAMELVLARRALDAVAGELQGAKVFRAPDGWCLEAWDELGPFRITARRTVPRLVISPRRAAGGSARQLEGSPS